ncbi:MAG: DUF892 family protein [Moheibacter sp.]
MATKEEIQDNQNTEIKVSQSTNDTGPLHTFFLDALKDMLWAENTILTGLQKMKKAATNEELIEAFEDHEFQSKRHVSRLKRVFEMMGEKAESKKCIAMDGLLKEAQEIIQSTPEGTATRDAALIIAAQKVEHYEIATYGGLVQIALTLDMPEIANLLEKTLEEEEDTDYILTEIAESFINFEAATEDTEETENKVK